MVVQLSSSWSIFLVTFSNLEGKCNPPGVETPTPPGVETPTAPVPAPTPPGVETPPVSPPACVCEARATYNADTSVTIAFDLCGAEPTQYDWIGIYPCNATTVTATQQWWADILVNYGYIGLPGVPMEYYGFEEGEVYVRDQPRWFTYTCSSPDGTSVEQCQTVGTTTWPSSGAVTINSAVAPDWAFWGDGDMSFDRQLKPGCYKALLNRELTDALSPPPLPTICEGQSWQNALTFQVP